MRTKEIKKICIIALVLLLLLGESVLASIVTYSSTNPLNLAKILRTIPMSQEYYGEGEDGKLIIPEKFNLKDVIPQNVVIKNQYSTGTCWAHASIGALESYLGLVDKRNGVQAKTYDFSEKHMGYFTSKEIRVGTKIINNPYGYGKEVDAGGRFDIAVNYFTNGLGAVAEEDMPFGTGYMGAIDEKKYEEFQEKTIIAEVLDTVEFPTAYVTGNNTGTVEKIKKQMKEHIMENGGILAGIGSPNKSSKYVNAEKGAVYFNKKQTDPDFEKHNVLIVGWDDNYSKTNFALMDVNGDGDYKIEDGDVTQPKNNGAWIIKNSWGEQNGDKGFYYMSYEDYYAYTGIYGITNATNTISSDNIYMHNELGYSNIYNQISVPAKVNENGNDTIYFANVFEKKTEEKEYLTKVSIYAPTSYICKVYINQNGNNINEIDFSKAIELKGDNGEKIESKNIGKGYHTLEFLDPIELTGDKGQEFVVVVEIQDEKQDGNVNVRLEYPNESLELYKNTTVSDKCFYTNENGEWNKLSEFEFKSGNNMVQGADSTIRAFTVSKDIGGIKIDKEPKTNYVIGEDFDETGMVVKAYYGTRNRSEVVTDYEIIGGENLTKDKKSITISYNEKTVSLPITVEEKKTTNSTNTDKKPSNNTNTVTKPNNSQNSNQSIQSTIISSKNPKNSDFDKAKGNVKSVKAYYYTDKKKQEYVIMDVEISNIDRSLDNYSEQYYYYLSTNKNESNIKDWVKIEDYKSEENSKLRFIVDTRDISNYKEVSNSDVLYIYIKEVALKAGKRAIVESDAMKLKTSDIIEEYEDDQKKGEIKVEESIQVDSEVEEINEEYKKTLPVEVWVILGLVLAVMILVAVANGKGDLKNKK